MLDILLQQGILQPQLRLIDLMALKRVSAGVRNAINGCVFAKTKFSVVEALKRLFILRFGHTAFEQNFGAEVYARTIDKSSVLTGSFLLECLYRTFKYANGETRLHSKGEFTANDIDIFSLSVGSGWGNGDHKALVTKTGNVVKERFAIDHDPHFGAYEKYVQANDFVCENECMSKELEKGQNFIGKYNCVFGDEILDTCSRFAFLKAAQVCECIDEISTEECQCFVPTKAVTPHLQMVKLCKAAVNQVSVHKKDALDDRTISTWIRDEFDLDFLRVVFDGEKLIVFKPMSVILKRSEWTSSESFFDRVQHLDFHPMRNPRYSTDRKPFYVKSRSEYVHLTMQDHLEKMRARSRKYTSRGFEVSISNAERKLLLLEAATSEQLFKKQKY